MKDKPDPTPGFLKMEQARKLMDQGQHQESLVLALEVLLEELDQLRDALQTLQAMTSPGQPVSTPEISEEPPDYYWLPPMKPRTLH